MEYNKDNVSIGTLFEIKSNDGLHLLFQNFTMQPYIWKNKTFLFAGGIEFIPPPRNINYDASQAKILTANIPPLSQYIRAFNGFKNCIVQAYIIYPDNPNATPVSHDILTVSSCAINGVTIEFNLENPLTNNTKFPSVKFITGKTNDKRRLGYVPEVPYSSSSPVY
jgi:hypothetical protein